MDTSTLAEFESFEIEIEVDPSPTYSDDDAFVISISIALLIFGALTNIRKAYHIVEARKKYPLPFGRAKKANRFEFYALTLFISNVIALTSSFLLSLAQIFPWPTLCRWRTGFEAMFRFATPAFLILFVTSRRPRADAFRRKFKIVLLFFLLCLWIAGAASPYFLYGNTEGVKFEKTSSSATSACRFRPPQLAVAYTVFAYSISFGFVVPAFILITKLCVFNTPLFTGRNTMYTESYKRYVINLITIWILCWTPCWTVEAYQFSLSLKKKDDDDDVAVVAAYVLRTLPAQISYVCFPLTCPTTLSERKIKKKLSTDSQFLSNATTGTNEVTSLSEQDPEQQQRPNSWRELSPLTHPVSTLLNITLSLTFPLLGTTSMRQTDPRQNDVQRVCVSVIDGEEEAETFL